MGKTLKVTAKGQVTLRKELLDHLGVGPGEKVIVDFLPRGRAEIRAAKGAGSIEDFIGCLASPGTPALSIEEINEIAARGWAGEL
ncbi:MAG: AbrB/MazE/SpoVT family DNA-binding domain-containing protein [Hyphomicrobiales bacterium]